MAKLATITLMPAAQEIIARESINRLPMEAGGILLGYRDQDTIVATQAIPVPTPVSQHNRYVRDDVLANRLLSAFLADKQLSDPTGYVGEWHSHPAPCAPSQLDLESLRATARDAAGPIALIVHTPGSPPRHTGRIARRRRFARIIVQESAVVVSTLPTPVLSPLPDGAVRGDGPIFISYRQSDGTERADSIEGLLRAAGLVVWRDHTDLRAGTTTDRLDQALTTGLSGAVLVVTPEIAYSTIVKERELPRLLKLDEDARFSLCIANEIPNADDDRRTDYGAPDRLLGLAPARTLGDKKQSNTRELGGRLEIVRDLLLHRIEQLGPRVSAAGRLTVSTQTRPTPSAMDVGGADLQIRIKAAIDGRLPSRSGLTDLQGVLPLTSDAINTATAPCVCIKGGMHLSVALALGAALPETKIGHVEVVDSRGAVWRSDPDDDPLIHQIAVTPVAPAPEPVAHGAVAVFVSLTENADTTAFHRLVTDQPASYCAAETISLTPPQPINPLEAARLSRQIAQEIKRLSSEFGRAEVHLAFHGPYTMAVLVGRLLSTLQIVVYEWGGPTAVGSRYVPVLRLEPGVANGPITEVC